VGQLVREAGAKLLDDFGQSRSEESNSMFSRSNIRQAAMFAPHPGPALALSSQQLDLF
jgi:hypothetical protein